MLANQRESHMKEHSAAAWQVASIYSSILASETRDLAAHVDIAIGAARIEGLKEAANWLRRQANAEKEPKARAAFIEAHNAILAKAEGRV
jgi:hypothetical protein